MNTRLATLNRRRQPSPALLALHRLDRGQRLRIIARIAELDRLAAIARRRPVISEDSSSTVIEVGRVYPTLVPDQCVTVEVTR